MIDGRHLVRLQKGENIVESLTKYLTENNIRAGSISGIGAADYVSLRYYSVEEQKYYGKEFEGEFEIASMNGNVSLMDGKIWPHLHIVLGDTDYKCFGGHLEEARIGVTCEIFIEPLDAEIDRTVDEETGLKVWSLHG